MKDRIWIVYGLFVFSAVWDLVLTLWNLWHLHFGFEANPIIRNWWLAILVKLIACLIFVKPTLNYDKKPLFEQICYVGTLMMLIFGQLYGGFTHIPFLIKESESTNTILTDQNVTFTINGELTTYSIPTDLITNALWYLKLVSILFIYPYIYLLISTWLALWTSKHKVKMYDKDKFVESERDE